MMNSKSQRILSPTPLISDSLNSNNNLFSTKKTDVLRKTLGEKNIEGGSGRGGGDSGWLTSPSSKKSTHTFSKKKETDN